MKIQDYIKVSSKTHFYNDGFRHFLEDHLNVLINHSETVELPLDDNTTYRWEGNLYGYLVQKNIPSHLHWIIMRMSNMLSPNEFGEEKSKILVPNPSVLDKLSQRYLTTHTL